MALLQEIQVPLLAVNDTTLTVVEIAFTTGQPVKKGDLIMVFETSKTTYDVEAEAEGYIQYLCETDHDYEVKEIVARIYSDAGEAVVIPSGKAVTPDKPILPENGKNADPGIKPVQTPVPTFAPAETLTDPVLQEPVYWEGETLFSREASRLIESTASKIDLSVFAGRDFVNKGDVLTFIEGRSGTGDVLPEPGKIKSYTQNLPIKKTGPQKAILPADTAKVILKRLTSGKKREIEYLGEVQADGLTSTIHTFVETEGIFTHINKSAKYLKNSLLPVIIYEVSRLLADFQPLNAYYTPDAIAFYKEINPGFAIDIDKGLKVLKIALAGQKSMPEIEETILRLSGNYLDDTLQLDDLVDVTFTITDLSSEGVAFFRPLINKMNSAILGVSAIDEKLQRCDLALTFDHRVTEGKLAARFLKELKERLESYRARPSLQQMQDITCFKCFKTLKEDLGGTGFAHCITPEGKEGYICQSCLKGF